MHFSSHSVILFSHVKQAKVRNIGQLPRSFIFWEEPINSGYIQSHPARVANNVSNTALNIIFKYHRQNLLFFEVYPDPFT